MSGKPALYAVGVTCLGVICFIISAVAVGLPIWGYYDSPISGYDTDRGYFGVFRVCKEFSYGRERCGEVVSRFRLTTTIFAAGIMATISCICLGIFSILSIMQMAMISSRDTVVCSYMANVIIKMVLAIIAALLAIIAAAMFAIDTDDRYSRQGFRVTRGVSFYLQILLIILSIGLVVMAVYDLIFARRTDGDPTKIPMPDSQTGPAITYNNPGFRDVGNTNNNNNGRPGSSQSSRNGVSMTDSSGKPYRISHYYDPKGSGSVATTMNGGSVQSMNTTLTSMSNGSTLDSITRSPLRSSLKKPRQNRDAQNTMGFQNPGFSGANQSPNMNRNGSVKKVRIQTHSTEV